MAKVSRTATGHQRFKCRAGITSTPMTTTSAAIRELCPEGNAQEPVSTMMSAGRGRSPTALTTSVRAWSPRAPRRRRWPNASAARGAAPPRRPRTRPGRAPPRGGRGTPRGASMQAVVRAADEAVPPVVEALPRRPGRVGAHPDRVAEHRQRHGDRQDQGEPRLAGRRWESCAASYPRRLRHQGSVERLSCSPRWSVPDRVPTRSGVPDRVPQRSGRGRVRALRWTRRRGRVGLARGVRGSPPHPGSSGLAWQYSLSGSIWPSSSTMSSVRSSPAPEAPGSCSAS